MDWHWRLMSIALRLVRFLPKLLEDASTLRFNPRGCRFP